VEQHGRRKGEAGYWCAVIFKRYKPVYRVLDAHGSEDKAYALPDKEFLDHALRYASKWMLKLDYRYEAESQDCDDFTDAGVVLLKNYGAKYLDGCSFAADAINYKRAGGWHQVIEVIMMDGHAVYIEPQWLLAVRNPRINLTGNEAETIRRGRKKPQRSVFSLLWGVND